MYTRNLQKQVQRCTEINISLNNTNLPLNYEVPVAKLNQNKDNNIHK